MAADSFNHAAGEARAAKKAADSAGEHGQRAFNEALASAERTLTEATKVAERVFREGLESLRSHGRAYTETAGKQVDEAQRYVVERVRERPLTATVAGLGVGLLIGLLLSHRDN